MLVLVLVLLLGLRIEPRPRASRQSYSSVSQIRPAKDAGWLRFIDKVSACGLGWWSACHHDVP